MVFLRDRNPKVASFSLSLSLSLAHDGDFDESEREGDRELENVRKRERAENVRKRERERFARNLSTAKAQLLRKVPLEKTTKDNDDDNDDKTGHLLIGASQEIEKLLKRRLPVDAYTTKPYFELDYLK